MNGDIGAQERGEKVDLGVQRGDFRRRCKAFLRRAPRALAWRPRKKYRVKAFLFLKQLHHQLHIGCASTGLKRFCQPEKLEERDENPLNWPALTVAAGAGPDIWAGRHFLLRSNLCCNLVYVQDANHLSWNAAKAAMKCANLWGLVLLLMCAQNMRFGPFGQGQRYRQCVEAFEFYTDMENPEEDPLFMHVLPMILEDWQQCDRMSERGIENEVWDTLRTAGPWARKGSPVNLSRWFSILKALRANDREWHTQVLAMTVASLELDYLKGTKFEKLLATSAGARRAEAPNGEERREMMKEMSAEQRRLQSSCANMLVTSCLIMWDGENQLRARLIEGLSGPMERWQQSSNILLRDVSQSIPWLLEQMNGGLVNVARETCHLLESRHLLRAIGVAGGGRFLRLETCNCHEVVRDDEFAMQAGSCGCFVVGLSSC